MDGYATATEQQRTRLPGGRAGAARVPLRGSVAALREQASVRHVPVPAAAAWLQQASARRSSTGQAHDQGAGHGQRLLVRQPLDRRLDAAPVRDVAPDRAAIEHGRLGAVRLLRVTFRPPECRSCWRWGETVLARRLFPALARGM